jgi:poly(3-hydroxybutyrate) depolymerase
VLGPGTHVVATCQAAPPAMVAAAMMAERKSDAVPATLTLMGGPIDTRVSPNVLTKLTENVPFKLFEKNNIHTVPPGYPAADGGSIPASTSFRASSRSTPSRTSSSMATS